jgi:hypothetical protein
MRVIALSFLLLSGLALAGCQSRAEKVKRSQDQFNAEYPAYAKACLDEDTSGAARLLTGERLTADLTADLEAKRKEREVRCKPEADRLAELQREILAAEQ